MDNINIYNKGVSDILKQRKTNGEHCDELGCNYYGKRLTNYGETHNGIGDAYCNLFNTKCNSAVGRETRATTEGEKVVLVNTQAYRVPSCVEMDAMCV
jgi:hypothetical protein